MAAFGQVWCGLGLRLLAGVGLTYVQPLLLRRIVRHIDGEVEMSTPLAFARSLTRQPQASLQRATPTLARTPALALTKARRSRSVARPPCSRSPRAARSPTPCSGGAATGWPCGYRRVTLTLTPTLAPTLTPTPIPTLTFTLTPTLTLTLTLTLTGERGAARL